MRKLAILAFQTLDGVMQAPTSPEEDASGGFDGGGWAKDYWAEVMEQVQKEAMSEPYDMLFGRTTYELFARHNMSADNPMAARMNKAKKYVVSNSLTQRMWQNTEVLTGDVPGQIVALKEQNGNLLQVHGSCGLIQTLLAHDLIDEIRLWTFPVIVGSGKRLFGDGAMPANFTLIKTGATPNGVIMGIYGRAGDR